MATKRTTFGKLQRERDKREKQQAKRDKRAAASSEERPPAPEQTSAQEQERIIEQLAELHQRYDDGAISLEDFELRRDELRQRLQV